MVMTHAAGEVSPVKQIIALLFGRFTGTAFGI